MFNTIKMEFRDAISMRRIVNSLLAIFLAGTMSACADTTTWQEEVKLSDGRVITITQKRRYEGVYTGQDFGSVVREAWLTVRLAEFGNQDIVWHENLMPWILNLDKGKLYIVGFPPTGLEFRKYGQQRPPYIGFRYENGQWLRIQFSEIPEAIYDPNLWVDNAPPNKSGHVSFADKAEEMRRPTLARFAKRIDPAYKSNFY